MNILLANDDGIECKGIQVLAERLSREHNVFVVAPDSNRSAVSHHFTMFGATKLKEYKKNQWACSGFPGDCAFIGVTSGLFNEKIDVVVSAINAGANLGTDIIYSGTCAAARQAVLDGVPAIAVSVDPDWSKVDKNGIKYDAIADFVAKNIETLKSLSSTEYPRIFVNVNGASVDEYKGVKFTDVLCVRTYGDKIKLEDTEDGKLSHYSIGGNKVRNYDSASDAVIVENNYVSVSRVYADPVGAKAVDELKFKL